MNKLRAAVPLSIEITDIITPKACSSFIAELIKYVAYNKQQIPYPYARLKMFVLKRIERQKVLELTSCSQDEKKPTSTRELFMMEKHYKKVEEAYEILDNTFRCIENKLMEPNGCPLEEIVLLFGATPISPKDVYRIKIPELTYGHSEGQHVWKRQIGNLFRGIIISDEINANLQRKVGLTNMFVMMKLKNGGYSESKWLLPKDHYRLSERAQQVCFSFKAMSSKPCTCSSHENHFQVLSESMEVLRLETDMPCISEPSSIQVSWTCSDEQCSWFQTAQTLKGFKDCTIQGKSVTDLWYKHEFISYS